MNMKKQARRERAAKRFRILNRGEWTTESICASSVGKFDRWDKRTGYGQEEYAPHYAAYVARKQVEKAALGL